MRLSVSQAVKALMAEKEETQEIDEQLDQTLDERTLHLLHDSKTDQELSKSKTAKRGAKKHELRNMKKPMAIPQVILDLQDEHCRESALRCLSSFLLEKREEDAENYSRAGYFLYNSCSTMTILLQEVITFFRMMTYQGPDVRSVKRLISVLTLFQCIAANKDTRQKFVESSVPNFLIPLVTFETNLEVYEAVQAVALSVIGILCQAREPKIIQWAVEINMVEVCQINIENGKELSKVLAMHILEAILQDDSGISYVCNPARDSMLKRLMKTWEDLVTTFSTDENFSPRLLFHIIRCYFLLCNHMRGLNVVTNSLPVPITNGSFNDIAQEFPIIGSLLQLLPVTTGKIEDPIVAALPHDLLLY